tara:strand:- start:541 stop:702 length:162 start_codon:yes stop_codon:yes gene_type:complete
MNQMQIAVVQSQACDQRILLMLSKTWLNQQPGRLINHQEPRIPKTLHKRVING